MKNIILFLSLFSYSMHNLALQKIEVKEISPTFDRSGYPDKTTIKSLIAAQYLHHFNKNKISIKKVKGGLYSEKMYVAMNKKNGKKIPMFFLKISKKDSSTKNLIKLQEGPVRKKFDEVVQRKRNLPKVSVQDLPHIVWLENVYSYQDKEGNKRTIEVTPSAQGLLVQDILDSLDKKISQEAGLALGKSLASFNQLFMNYNNSDDPEKWQTVLHGDFSVKNSLYDPTTQKIYFIDNEDMRKGSIAQDIKTILISLLMFRYLQKDYNSRWPVYLEYCQAFLKGYIESYPIEIRPKLSTFIEKVLNNGLQKASQRNVVLNIKKFDEQEFKKVIYSYLHSFK